MQAYLLLQVSLKVPEHEKPCLLAKHLPKSTAEILSLKVHLFIVLTLINTNSFLLGIE